MEEVREFVKGLRILEYELVSMEIDGEPILLKLRDVIKEIIEIGVKEVIDTYLEGIEFISLNNKKIGLFAVC